MNPQDEDLEAVIIGACLIEKTAMPLIAEKIRPEMLYQVKHELIFATLLAMYRGGTDIDIITLKEEMTHLMEDTMEEAHLRVANGKDGVTGIPTGLPELDKLTAGWQRGEFIVGAARPAVGKTAFALLLAQTAARSGYHNSLTRIAPYVPPLEWMLTHSKA